MSKRKRNPESYTSMSHRKYKYLTKLVFRIFDENPNVEFSAKTIAKAFSQNVDDIACFLHNFHRQKGLTLLQYPTSDELFYYKDTISNL